MLTVREVAAALNGEVVGEKVCVQTPDGEITVSVYPNDVYVYHGGKAATDWVRACLGLPPRPPAASLELVERIWYSCDLLTDIGKSWLTRERRWKKRPDYLGSASLVVHYLNSRGITIIPEDVGFHPELWHSGIKWKVPAMVAARRDVRGEIVAIHRTYLNRDGEKASLFGHAVKKDYGSTRGTAIRLAPLAEKMLIAEGIENALSVMQVTGIGAWAAGSAAALRTLILPPEVRHVIILVDGDEAGRRASLAAGSRWRTERRKVELLYAPPNKDFNDLLIEGGLSSIVGRL